MVAQFLWETNEGTSRLFQEQKNMFGIKCRTKDTISTGYYPPISNAKRFQSECFKGYALYRGYNDSVGDLHLWLEAAYQRCKSKALDESLRQMQTDEILSYSPTDANRRDIISNLQKVWNGELSANHAVIIDVYSYWSGRASQCIPESIWRYAAFLKKNSYYEADMTQYGAGMELFLKKYENGDYQ